MKLTAAIGLGDAISLLREEGFDNAGHARIYHAIKVGHIPRPELDGGIRYRFTRKDLRNVRAYLSNVPAAGRQPKVLV